MRGRFWRSIAHVHRGGVEPNGAHRALAGLESAAVAVRVLTQNVDGLHQKAGSSARKVVELHGSIATCRCLSCDAKIPTERVLDLPFKRP